MGLTPPDALFEKTLSNVEEVMARGGRGVMILGCRGDRPPRRPLCIRHRCAALRILCGAATLGSVEVHRELMTAAARWIIAWKLRSVLSARMAIRLNSLSLQKKFSIRWRHLYISVSIRSGVVRRGC